MQRYLDACPIGCTAPLIETDIALPEGVLLRCASCGQLVSQATPRRYWDTMAQFDGTDYNQPRGRELARRNRLAQRRLRIIARLLKKQPQSIRILDVGCSRGQFVQAAAALGFDAAGVEPAPRAAAAARGAGLRVHQGLLEEQRFPEQSFDAVTLFEVIEHLKAPRALLAECRRILRTGGILMLTTGNAASWTTAVMKSRWDYFRMEQDGGHISFFNPASLVRLAAGCGFAVERISTARVKFHEKGDCAPWLYTALKGTAELLNVAARVSGKGHDMLACLRRTKAS